MPWNGSGQFNRTNGVFTGAAVWDDSRVAGRTVRSDDHDTHDEDIATGMENTVTRDGQNQPTTNLPMGGFRHTGVDDAAARTDYAAAGQIQDQDLTHIVPTAVAGTGDAITLSPTPAITTYTAGQLWSFIAEATNTGATTINVSSLGVRAVQKLGAALVAGDITTGDLVVVRDDGTQFQMVSPARTPVLTSGGIPFTALADGTDGQIITWDATGAIAAVGPGTSGQVLTSNGAGAAPSFQLIDTSLPRSYLAGLQTSNNSTDSDHDVDIAVGECRGSDDDEDIALASVFVKQIDASWAAGTNAGGLSSSLTLSADTWYHVHAINVGGFSDVGFDTSLTAANLVTDHSATAYRRIGAVLTDASSNISAFKQAGNTFLWIDPQDDFAGAGSSTGATATLSTPPGLELNANVIIHTDGLQGGGTKIHYLSNLDVNNDAASISASPGYSVGFSSNAATTATGGGQVVVLTNTSSQIRYRSGDGTNIEIHTLGWWDPRGRDD